ncbi:MAG: phosphopantothenoylcysteine decarboxylase [Planctomycetota bacterium]|nr:phosphopantothenoylcysteine decarboxylase [Planctomycetota bacterium]
MDIDLHSREVLLCVTGGVACYKAADLASRLVRAGAGVTVALTEAACRFVVPLTFRALTGRAVHTSLWETSGGHDMEHIALTEQAHVMVVAPATANILGKLACGIADDLVSTLALTASGACPIVLAPAMNSRMWAARAVQENVKTLRARGCQFVGPGEGRLACGTVGPGRMAEPEEIVAKIAEVLAKG